ncbi:globin-coupled sensor protein [Paenibacillus thalictri]|uniref:Methyl-accepting transducer domain-containing protein n=1 Tax=Paenibacillus thalictri TaxID=2527873 RepID=A0A4V2J4W6_9BACL|nr:globin-coupled sensor protein [Paenibacillus thalictri]TBL81282.1 hypothetical protein EYB31_04125 [Paenibacillus thalictri]
MKGLLTINYSPLQKLAGKLNRKPASAATEGSWLEKAQSQSVTVSLKGHPEIASQMTMIRLAEPDLKLLKALQPLIRSHIEEITSSFYDTVLGIDQLGRIIHQNSSVDRLRLTLETHISEMFNGIIDNEFIGKRLKIAKVHQSIGLKPKWYLGAFQNLQDKLLEVVHKEISNPEESLIVSKAITKLLNFEQQLVLEAYENEEMRMREKRDRQIKDDLKAQIAAVSEELVLLTGQVNASVQELIASSGTMLGTFRGSVDKSHQSKELASNGQQKMSHLNSQIGLIHESAMGMEKSAEQLDASSVQINSIVGMVQEIADQTKLLSLNASIEAARAGEQGRGFAVVATEVQKLSEDTKQAVSQISGLIAASGDYTRDVVAAVRNVQMLVGHGQAEAQATNGMFDQIVTSMEQSISEIGRIEQEMTSLSAAIEEIGSAAEKVTDSAERLTQTTQTL